MRFFISTLAISLLGFYSVGTPPGTDFELTQLPKNQIHETLPDERLVQVSPRLIIIPIKGKIEITNFAPKCSLYYGLQGENLVVGKGIAQVDQNEIKPGSSRVLQTNGVLSLICAPGQAFPIKIRQLS